MARVKAVLRRTGSTALSPSAEKDATADKTMSCGTLVLDQERFQVFWNGTEIPLTATEFGLLKALMSHPGRVYSRDELMDRAYEHGTMVTDRTIDSHIRKVRSKFREAGGEPICTVRGVGYKLGTC